MRRWLLVLVFAGCAEPGPTWRGGVAEVVADRCGSCHQQGGIAPIPLTTYAEASAVAGPIAASVASGEMPPWQPDNGCNTYAGDLSLTEAQRAMILDWVDAGAPEGRGEEPSPGLPAASSVEGDVEVVLPEAYTPSATEVDDYRCQIVAWPLDAPAFITGFRVLPERAEEVHHTIVFAASASAAASYRALDEADPGPGYACFGGAGAVDRGALAEGLSSDELAAALAALADGELPVLPEGRDVDLGAGAARWIGAWVPGSSGEAFPEGSGLAMSPGDVLIVQMHYNTTSTAPVPDQSRVQLDVAESVERPAYVLPFTDLGWVSGIPVLGEPMTIPAGDPAVVHTTEVAADGLIFGRARAAIGASDGAPLRLHSVGQHMHQLGVSGSIEKVAADGDETCLLSLPAWDFHWQGSYRLSAPVDLAPTDLVRLSCTWDNSAEHQPLVDGAPQEPRDVAWGEGTRDEMCLGIAYVTAAP